MLDRMYNVRAMLNWAGALVERYAYDPYGLPLIRESAGLGDMNNDAYFRTPDRPRVVSACTSMGITEPRADVDDDGTVELNGQDITAYDAKAPNWYPASSPTVAQAFSDVDNPYMFQGVPHYALDTESTDTVATLPLNHHRARFADPVTGRWLTRDPAGYVDGLNLFAFVMNNALKYLDPFGFEGKITIYVKRGTNAVLLFFTGDAGHSWVEVEDKDGNTTNSGFYPDEEVAIDDFVEGDKYPPVYTDDSTTKHDEKFVFVVSDEGVKAALEKIKERIDKGEPWWKKNQCTDHACEVAIAGGVEIDKSKVKTLGCSLPNKLGDYLREKKEKEKKPSTQPGTTQPASSQPASTGN